MRFKVSRRWYAVRTARVVGHASVEGPTEVVTYGLFIEGALRPRASAVVNGLVGPCEVVAHGGRGGDLRMYVADEQHMNDMLGALGAPPLRSIERAYVRRLASEWAHTRETCSTCPRCGEPLRLRYPGGDPENGPARWACPSEHYHAERCELCPRNEHNALHQDARGRWHDRWGFVSDAEEGIVQTRDGRRWTWPDAAEAAQDVRMQGGDAAVQAAIDAGWLPSADAFDEPHWGGPPHDAATATGMYDRYDG